MNSSLPNWLADYSFQALPDLGTGLRDPPKGVHHVSSDISVDVIKNENVVPLESLLRAAFLKVILLYLDTRDFLFADASSGRDVPLRAQIRDGQTFRDFASDLEDNSRLEEALDRAELRRMLGLKDDENPLPVVFLWGETSVSEHFQSSMTLVGRDSRVDLHCSSTVMSLHAAQVFLDQVIATLSFAGSHLDKSVTSPLTLPRSLMSACETEYSPESAELIPVWLMQNASSRPDAVAHEVYKTVTEPPEVITYGALNSRSNRLARWLVGKGLQKEDKVAVCRMRDAHFYVAHAAIFKSGGCYVSIDPELPEERKRYIVQDSEARFVLTTPEHAELFGVRAVVLEEPGIQGVIAKEDGSDICLAELDDLAYLLYTSGTTGTPKGCLLNHRGLYWAIDAMCAFPRQVTDPDTDKRLALASIAFDVHISEICQSWHLGTRLVSGPRYELLANLQENIITMGITHLGTVPSMIEATLSSPDDLPLKYLVSGGEKISDALLQKWANHPKLILANFYGPTEATVGCTSRQVKMGDRKENIGRPFPSCQAYVVDAEMNVVPRGSPGELVVEGPLVGRGYNKLPDVTKKVFLEWPRPGCRCYRTGDLVRLMPDDTLEIMGRIDTQIKLRGVRIESEGVSNVLRSACSEAMDVSTLISAHPDLGGTEVLVSFVAIADSTITFLRRRSEHPTIVDTMLSVVQDMRDAALRELAVYMRPSYIVPLNFLPLSINGKTDNKILARIFRETSVQRLLHLQGHAVTAQSNSSSRLPSETEARVIDAVAELTGMDPESLSPLSNLFECGLDSLKFSTLAGVLRKGFSRNVSAAQLMSNPVIDEVGSLLDQAIPAEARGETTSLATFANLWQEVAESVFEPDQIEAVFPPFPVQEGILFRSTQSPELYVQHFMYRCDSSVDTARMKASWDCVVARQQILRTVFISDETLLQVVLKHGIHELPYPELSRSFSGETFEDWFIREESLNVATRINEDFTTPLFSINVYDMNENGKFMVFSINHALYDGNAMPLIIREFRLSYTGSPLPVSVPLAPILETLYDVDDLSNEKFWRSQFSQVDLDEVVVRHPSESRGVFMSHTLETSFSDLQAHCNAAHVTLQAFFSAAFALAGRNIFRWGRNAIFGTVQSGRSLPVENVGEAICPLVSVVPIVLPVSSETPSSQLLGAAQRYINDMLPHEHTPLGRIHRWLNVKDLVEVLLSCRFDSESKGKDVIEHIGSSHSQPEFIFALELVVHSTDDTVEARFSFTEADLPREEILRLIQQFEGCVDTLMHGQGSVNNTDVFKLSAPNKPESNQEALDANLESVLIRFIANFLHIDGRTLYPTTSLASLGLSSLKAVSLARTLLQQGIKVAPVAIIQADHVRAISRRVNVDGASFQNAEEAETWLLQLKEQLQEDLDMDALKLSPNDELELTGCTALQTGMLAQTLNSAGRLYVHAFTFQLYPHCDIDKLKSAWYHATQQLSILRTSFHFAPNVGQWAQVVHSDIDFKWSSSQPSHLSSAAAVEFISSLSFDKEETLSRPPVYFQHVSAQNDYLIVVLHHALYDGLAIPKLLQYVKRLYRGDEMPPQVSFHRIANAILVQEKEGTKYWAKHLEGVSPWRFPRVQESSDNAWRASIVVDIPVTEIRRFCRRYHVHPQCLGQASWAKILCRRSKLPAVVFGQVISGRTLTGAEDVIGPVFNTVPCKVTLYRGQTNKQLVRSIHEWNNDALPWQHASLRTIQRQLRIPDLLDTLFLFQPHGVSPDEEQLWTVIGRGDMQESKTQHAMNIELHENSSMYNIHASCAASVMNHAGLVDLLHEFNEIFKEIIRTPSRDAIPQYNELIMQTFPATSVIPISPAEHIQSTTKAWSPRQRQMHKILVEFTGLPAEAVSPRTTLTAIGIDSICAIQVAALARRAGIGLVASDVARSSTVMDLLSQLDDVGQHRFSLPASVALPQPIVDAARNSISFSQQEALDRVVPISAGMEADVSFWKSKGAVFSFKIDREGSIGDLSSRLRASWSQLSQKHEILRSFLLRTGERDYRLVLGILKVFHYQWLEEILDTDPHEVDSVKKQAEVFAVTPIPMDQPPVRLALLHGKCSSYFVLSLHHVQYDGWSLPILVRDLEKLFSGQSIISESNLDGFLRLFVRTPEVLDEQAAHWKRVFPSDFRPQLLPAGNLSPGNEVRWLPSSISSHIVRFLPSMSDIIPRQITRPPTFVKLASLIGSLQALEKRAQSLQVSSQSILLACWSITQAKWSSSSRATFLLAQVGRSGILSDLDVLAAPCCNYVPTHVTMDFDPQETNVDTSVISFRVLAVARQIQADITSRTPVVEQTRVRDIADWIGISGQPICNVSVNVLKLPGDVGRSNDQPSRSTARLLQPLKLPYNPRPSLPFPDDPFFPEIQRDCQVEIFYRSNNDSVGISIECDSSLLSPEQAGRMGTDWATLVKCV